MKRFLTLFLMLLAFVAGANAANYDLKIAGTTVTSNNASDVLGDGVFFYDATDNTLYINGSYTMSSSQTRIVDSNMPGLTVVIADDAVLTNSEGEVFCFGQSASITGSGKLTVIAPKECGFFLVSGASLTIYDAEDIDIQAFWGIAGPSPNVQRGEKLTINNSNVTIAASGTLSYYEPAAISDLNGGFELVKSYISSPQGAYFDTKDLKEADGSVAKNVTIEKSIVTTTIDGINYELDKGTKEAAVAWNNYSGTIDIPASVTYAGETYAVTSMNAWSFSGMSVVSITLPEGLTTIGDGVMNSCSSLTTVSLPSTLTSVGNFQFLNDPALESVYCYATTPPEAVAALIAEGNTATLYVPAGSVSAYQNALGWSDFSNIVKIPIVYGDNMILNGGFEGTDLSAFNKTEMLASIYNQPFTADDLVEDDNHNHYYLTHFGQTDASQPWQNRIDINLNGTLNPGDKFRFSMRAKASAPVTISCHGQGEANGATLNVWGLVGELNLTDEWQTITVEKTVPEDAEGPMNQLSFFLGVDDADGMDFYFDDLSLAKEALIVVCDGIKYSLDQENQTAKVINNEYTGEITIPASVAYEGVTYAVTSLDDWAFGSSSVTKVTLPEGLTTIGQLAFFNCSSLTSISLPAGVTDIPPGTFYDCPLTEVYCYAETPPTLNTGFASFTCYSTATLYVPAGCLSAYQEADGWKNFATILEMSYENMIVNGDFEGTDMSAFSCLQMGGGNYAPYNYTLTEVYDGDGDGHFLGTWFNGVDVDSNGNPTVWQNQFKIKLNGSLSAGDCFRFSMRARTLSDGDQVTISGQGIYTTPEAAYDLEAYWGLLGEFNVTNNWQTFEIEGVVPESTTNYGVNELRFFIPVTGSGMMILFDDFCLQKVTAIADTDYSLIDNTLYLERTVSVAEAQTTLSVKMKNTVDVRGYQFDLYLPQGVTVATDADGLPMAALSTARTTSRKTDYFDSSFNDDGSLRVLCGSLAGYTFDGNDGEVATIKVNIAEGMAEGEYPVFLKNVVLTDNQTGRYSTDQLKSTLAIVPYTLGDVNADLKIDVTDFIAVGNNILGQTQGSFVFKAADIDRNDTIDVVDFIGVANLILSGATVNHAPKAAPARAAAPKKAATDIDALADVIYVEPVTAAPGTRQALSIQMKNTNPVAGYQFDLQLPEGISVATDDDGFPMAELSLERTSATRTNSFSSEYQADGTLRVLCGTTAKDPSTGRVCTFRGNAGEVARIYVDVPADYDLGTYEVSILGGVLASDQEERTELPATVTTEIEVADNTVVLDENDSDVPEATAGDVNILVRRTIAANQWSTICLPFSMTEEQVHAAFGDDVQLQELDSYDAECDADQNVTRIVVNFEDADLSKGFYANYPYMIRTTKDITEFRVTSTIEPDEEDCYAEYAEGKGKNRYVYGTFYGTLHAQTVVPANCLFLSGGKFWYSVGLTEMKAFRGYFEFEDVLSDLDSSSANILMQFDQPTGISQFTIDNSQLGSGYYTLDGRKLDKKPTQKGIYVHHGKKEVVK